MALALFVELMAIPYLLEVALEEGEAADRTVSHNAILYGYTLKGKVHAEYTAFPSIKILFLFQDEHIDRNPYETHSLFAEDS